MPFDDGKTISCLFHLLPDRRKAPVMSTCPAWTRPRKRFRASTNNVALARGFHVLSMDGPGQGSSNMQKIRAVGDNYERAGAAVISCLRKRKEVNPQQDRDLRHQHGQLLVAAAGELRPPHRRGGERDRLLQSEQHDLHAVVAALQADVHVHGGLHDEEKFDREVAQPMTVRGHLDKIRCPTLLSTGEFDPLCPLEDAIEAYEELKSPKEMWVFENQYHSAAIATNLGGLDNHDYFLDWLHDVLVGKGLPRTTPPSPISGSPATGRGATAHGSRP